jgi:salicylate hydroxylase
VKVAIVGAGIGGLTLGLALRHFGHTFSIHEQSPALREVGAGITLWPNATRLLFALGLQDALDAVAVEPVAQKLMHCETGEVLQTFPRAQATREAYGAPLYQLHRRDLHDILLSAVAARAPGAIHLGQEAVGVEHAGDGARVRFSGGAQVEADLVVGCDGIKSRVREQLFGHEAPRFTNIIAWRALVPAASLPARLREEPTGIHVGRGSNFAHYLVRRGELLNYLAFAVVPDWEDEGWRIAARVADVQERFREYSAPIHELIAATPPETLFKWGLFDRDVRERWSDGPVTLLGDAAHPMLPFLGQGAGMVIEDCIVLARALARGDDLPAALARYEAARRPRTTYATLKSRQHSRYYNSHPDDARAEDFASEIDLNEYDAMTVAI